MESKLTNAACLSSRGVPIHPEATGVENFNKWFAKSAVVDSHGRPMVMFHGTQRSFESFDPKKIGDTFAADAVGFFAVNCPILASEYAEGEGGNVMPLFVSLQNPLVIDKKFLTKEGMAPIGERDCVVTFWDTYQRLILEWMNDRSADGAVLIDESVSPDNPSVMTVALHPHQMKSALGNSGVFALKSNSTTDAVGETCDSRLSRASKARSVAQSGVGVGVGVGARPNTRSGLGR